MEEIEDCITINFGGSVVEKLFLGFLQHTYIIFTMICSFDINEV